jgi:hypothetical protein
LDSLKSSELPKNNGFERGEVTNEILAAAGLPALEDE